MSDEKRFGLAHAIFNWICILFILYALGRTVLPRMSQNTQSSAVPPLCTDSLQLDMQGVNDYSKKTLSYVDIPPGANDKVCFGPLVSIPHWSVWDVQFLDLNAEKDACVAWFQYWGIDRIYGPIHWNQTIGWDNMPGKWRIASNCTIRYYQRG